MNKTIYDLLPDDVKQQWDQEDYKLLCPESLDDEPVVQVVLINKNETEIIVDLQLQS